MPEGAGAGTLKLKSQKISEHLKRQTEQAQPIVMKRSEFKI